MTVVLCKVLGRGDISNLDPGELRDLDGDDLAEVLTSPPGGEAHHGALPPIGALVAMVADALEHPDGGSRSGPVPIVLIASQQDPPHPEDTLEVARLIERALRHRPALYGMPLVPVVARVPFTADGAMETAARTFTGLQASRVMVAVGGSVVLLCGAVLGALDSGARVEVVPVNRQDRDAPVRPVAVGADLTRWLARTRRYATLARTGPPAHRRAFAAAAHLSRLRWSEAAKQHTRLLAGPRPDDLRRVPVLRDYQSLQYGSDRLRQVAKLAEQLKRCYALALRSALVADEPFAANLIRPWLSLRFDVELFRSGPEAFDAIKALRDRAEPDRSDHESLALLVRSDRRNEVRKALPHALAKLASDTVLDLWRRAASADHELRPLDAGVRDLLALAGLDSEPDIAARLHEQLGLPAGRPLRPTGRLCFLPVGRSHRHPDDPFLAALLAEQDAPTDLVLVASAGTAEMAGHLAEQATARGVQAQVIEIGDMNDLVAVRDGLGDWLARQPDRLAGLDEVAVVVGPGTAAMALGTLLAAVTVAFEHHARLKVASAHPNRDGSTRLHWAPTGSELALFVDSAAVADAVTAALDHWDLALAEDLCARAGRRWADARDGCRALRNRFFAVDADPAGVAARLDALERLAGTDPHLALYLAAAVVDTYVDRTGRDLPGARDLQGDRTHSPLGHAPARERTPHEVREAIRRCRDGLAVSSAVPSFVDEHARLRELVGQLGNRPG